MAELDVAPGVANVTITLTFDDQTQDVELKPSLYALTQLSAIAPCFPSPESPNEDCIFNRIRRRDLNTMCAVIRFGSGSGAGADPKLPDKVFKTGLNELMAPLSMFISRLTNGGRPLVDVVDKDGEAPLQDGSTR